MDSFTLKTVDITSAYTFFWNLVFGVWRWMDSIQLVVGPVSFTLFELSISMLMLWIVWEMIFMKLLFDS